MDNNPQPRPARALVVLYAAAALGSLVLILEPLFGYRCPACSGGVLSLGLPWAGLLFYSFLAILARRSPGSATLAMAPGFTVFAHGVLVTEMFRTHPPCIGCLAVAAFASAAALCQLARTPKEWPTVAMAVVLGCGAGFLSPFDRVDDL